MLCDGLRIDFNQCQWEPLTIYVIMNIEKYRHILSHHFQYENDVKHTVRVSKTTTTTTKPIIDWSTDLDSVRSS